MKPPYAVRLERKLPFLLIAGLAFFALHCFEKPQSFVSPNWDTQLSIPLVDSTYRLSQAMSSNPDVKIDSSGYVYQPALYRYNPVSIGDYLKLYPPFEVPQVVTRTIGIVELPTPPPIQGVVSAATLFGGSLPPASTPVPAIPLQTFPQGAIPDIPGFEFAHFTSGTMQIAIHNNLSIPIEFPSGFSLKNNDGGDVVASYPPSDVIAPYGTWNPPAAIMNNVMLRNSLAFLAQFQSAGSGGDPVTFDDNSGISVDIALGTIMVDSARATIFRPFTQSASYTPYIVDDSTFLGNVTCTSGAMQIIVTSNLDVAATVKVTIEELRDAQTDKPFSVDTIRLDGHTNKILPIDMRQWRIKAPNIGDTLTNTLTFGVTLKSDSMTSSTPVTVSASNFISASLQATETPFKIQAISGVFRPLRLNVDQTVAIPWPLPQDFSFDSVATDLLGINLLVNEPGHTVDLDLTLTGLDASGYPICTIPSTKGRIAPNRDAIFAFDPAVMATFLSRYISKHGASIELSGTASINPVDVYAMIPHEKGVLTDTSNLYLSLGLSVPVHGAVYNGFIRDTVIVTDNSSDGHHVDKDLLTSVKQASLYFVVENAIPMGVDFHLDFRDIFGNTLLTLPKPGQSPISVSQGSVASPARPPTIEISISNDDAKLFGDAATVIVSIGLNKTDKTQPFTVDDYIHVRAYSNMVFNVNPDKLKNK